MGIGTLGHQKKKEKNLSKTLDVTLPGTRTPTSTVFEIPKEAHTGVVTVPHLGVVPGLHCLRILLLSGVLGLLDECVEALVDNLDVCIELNLYTSRMCSHTQCKLLNLLRLVPSCSACWRKTMGDKTRAGSPQTQSACTGYTEYTRNWTG